MSLDEAFNWSKASAPQVTPLAGTPSTPVPFMDAEQAPPSSTDPPTTPPRPAPSQLSSMPDTHMDLAPGDCYVELSPIAEHHELSEQTPAPTSAPSTSTSSSHPGLPSLPESARNSIGTVFEPTYTKGHPKQAARCLITMLEQYTSSNESTFRSRPMNLEDRKSIIASIRDADSTAFWGAILDESKGRQMLASWLRDTMHMDVWAPTRLPLLRLLMAMPLLPVHIVDEANNSCLGKAVGVVSRKGPTKAKALASELRQKWSDIVNGITPAVPKPPVKQLAIEPDRESSHVIRKSKASTAEQSGSAPVSSQSLNTLSQSSAYLQAAGSLGSSHSAPATSRLNTATGTSRSSDMQSLAKKTVTRGDSSLKQVCSRCSATFIPGVTSSVRVRPSAAHTQTIDQLCLRCRAATRKTPAPPTKSQKSGKALAIDDEDDEERAQPAQKAVPAKRSAPAADLFTSLMSKGPAKVPKIEPKAPAAPIKKKKKVHWKSDAELCAVQIFESFVDPDEQMHHSIEERGRLEIDEGLSLKAARSIDLFDEEQDWYEPRAVEMTDAPEHALGAKSTLAAEEEERQKTVLAAIYIEDSEIPDSPAEPPARPTSESGEAQVIPLPEKYSQEPAPLEAAQVNVAELMKQLEANPAAAASGAAAQGSSLAALGISTDQLQQLLGNVSGNGTGGNANAAGAAQPDYQAYPHAQQQHGGWGQHPAGSPYGYAPPASGYGQGQEHHQAWQSQQQQQQQPEQGYGGAQGWYGAGVQGSWGGYGGGNAGRGGNGRGGYHGRQGGW